MRHFDMKTNLLFMAALLPATCAVMLGQTETRPRVRDLGVEVGVLHPGPLNAITDVVGVKVGQTTLIRGDNIRTGVTAILPHGGNLYKERVPGAVFLGNAYGKLAGSTQVNEMGEIESPILLTATDSVPRVADAVTTYMFNLKGNENVLSVNPLVGETNDGYLSDIRSRPITPEDVFAAINNAKMCIRDRHRGFTEVHRGKTNRGPNQPLGTWASFCRVQRMSAATKAQTAAFISWL